jgi:hypothetical protein
MATRNIAYGTYTAMTVTSLQSLPSSATVTWQSDRIDNQSATKAIDYEIFVKLPMTTVAPANDKAVYVFASPAITTDGGTTWLHADQGTSTLPTGSQGTGLMASGGGNMRMLGAMVATTNSGPICGSFNLSSAVGNSMPDGFSLVINNYTGAATSAAGCVVAYRAITETIA